MKSSRTALVKLPDNSAFTRLCGVSDKRYKLWVYPSVNANIYLSNDPTANVLNAICIQSGGHPLELCIEDDGDCVQREWYIATDNMTGFSVTFIEVMEPCPCKIEPITPARRYSGAKA